MERTPAEKTQQLLVLAWRLIESIQKVEERLPDDLPKSYLAHSRNHIREATKTLGVAVREMRDKQKDKE